MLSLVCFSTEDRKIAWCRQVEQNIQLVAIVGPSAGALFLLFWSGMGVCWNVQHRRDLGLILGQGCVVADQ